MSKELREINALNHDELSDYQEKKAQENYKRFMEIVRYDFNKMIVKKNIGDEARTFNIMNQSKPLLSPSRISKIFTEHIFGNIPYSNLIMPRLMGQLVHKFIEMKLVLKDIIKLTRDNLEEYTGKDYSYILEHWSEQKINTFIEEVNEAVSNIHNFLNTKKVKILACEKHVCNEDYHGFIDMVGFKYFNEDSSGNRSPMIIDLKITTKEEIMSAYYLQLSIYREIFERTAHCYILFYDRNTKKCRLEKASGAQLDRTFEMIDTLNKYMRS